MRADDRSVICANLRDPYRQPATDLNQTRRPYYVSSGSCDIIGRQVHCERTLAPLYCGHDRDPNGNVCNNNDASAVKGAP